MAQLQTEQAASLEIKNVSASYAGLQAVRNLSLTIPPSKLLTLLGPSGCGKSTTLRSAAGLHQIDSGEIRIGGEVVAAHNLHLRPEHRRINMVFQSYAIWPHMSVAENVGYGLKMRGVPRAEIAKRVAEVLDLVGLGSFASRPATGLSGGQQQRVALARALATQPRVLLLDEPLSNLDTVLRQRMRSEIMRIQQETGTTTLYVTHDCSEALSMSDEVIVMNKGEIAQAGAPGELYRYPNSRFVAEFLGQANVIPARIEEARATEVAVRLTELDGAPRLIAHRRPGQAASAGDNVDLFIRPESFTLAGEGGGDQRIQVEVVGREFLGSRTEVSARSGSTAIKFELVSYAEIAPGDRVTLEIGPQAIAWAPAS